MKEILEIIKKQIEQLEKLQNNLSDKTLKISKTIEISVQINELVKTAFQIIRSNQSKKVTVFEEPVQKQSWEEMSREIAKGISDYATMRAAEIRAEREAKCGKAEEDLK